MPRASNLPDDGAGVFAPGWDASRDKKGNILHLATYALGSRFPEDAKLCAALSTFWPAVAPDVFRTMPMHQGSARGTVAPLTDLEIGQVGTLPWDGVSGPQIVQDNGKSFVEMAAFLHVDYVRNAVENRFSNRLLAQITTEEYQRRVLAAARVNFVVGGGGDVSVTRPQWLFVSFRAVVSGDPELIAAPQDAGKILTVRSTAWKPASSARIPRRFYRRKDRASNGCPCSATRPYCNGRRGVRSPAPGSRSEMEPRRHRVNRVTATCRTC